MVWLRLRHWNIFIEIKPEVADMIEKMKFLSITGPKADIDRVVNQYLAKYEIHLENAMAQLTLLQKAGNIRYDKLIFL